MHERPLSLRVPFHATSLAFLFASAALAQGTTERVSVATGGAQADGDSQLPSVSADGRYVVFYSAATNLVAGDTNGQLDVFLRDRVLQTTTLVSRSTGGVQGNDSSAGARVSADGRKVFYYSNATNLVSGDTNATTDVFAYDVATGTTTRVNTNASGTQAAGGYSVLQSCSEDARVVAFWSRAFNLVPGDTNNTDDAFAKDLSTGVVTRLSVSSSGAQSSQPCKYPAISGDGRWAAFSADGALAPNDLNTQEDVYVHDIATGLTELVSVNTQGNAGATYFAIPAISREGRYVAFSSAASDLVALDTNGAVDVFVRDRAAGVTLLASLGVGGVQANDWSLFPALSSSGQFVAFRSLADNLVPNDGNPAGDVFVRDWRAGVTQRASVTNSGAPANNWCDWPDLTPDGREIVFTSDADNLVPGDTNVKRDIFLRSATPPAPYAYCTAGTTSSGCVPSIRANAQPSLSFATPCDVVVTEVEGQRTGLIFYGVDNAGFSAVPWGPSSSFLCIKSPTQRTPAQFSGGTLGACDGQLTLDWNAFRAANPAALGQPGSLGASAYLQAWFRDPASPKTTMLSDALQLEYVP